MNIRSEGYSRVGEGGREGGMGRGGDSIQCYTLTKKDELVRPALDNGQ